MLVVVPLQLWVKIHAHLANSLKQLLLQVWHPQV
jgi:hypothetical protein